MNVPPWNFGQVAWLHAFFTVTGKVATTSPPFYNEPHQSHVLCVNTELGTTSTSWSPVTDYKPVSSEISDITPCTHAQRNILHVRYADKTDY